MPQKKRKLVGDTGRDGNGHDDSSSGRAGARTGGSTGEAGPVGMDHEGRMEKVAVGGPTEKYAEQGQYAEQQYAEPLGKGKLPAEERGAAGRGGADYMAVDDEEEDRVRRNNMMHCRGGAGEVGTGGDAANAFGAKSSLPAAGAGAASASSQEQVCLSEAFSFFVWLFALSIIVCAFCSCCFSFSFSFLFVFFVHIDVCYLYFFVAVYFKFFGTCYAPGTLYRYFIPVSARVNQAQ